MKSIRSIVLIGMLAAILVPLAKADPITTQVGPTWNILAGGWFTGGGQAESFNFDLTLTFEQNFAGLPGFIMPLWSGTASFAGVLGTWTDTFSNVRPGEADGGYLAFVDPLHIADINVHVSHYPYYTPLTLEQTFSPPFIGVPYLYSCNWPDVGGADVCAAFGAPVGLGLFWGWGEVVQTVSQQSVAVPEPSSILLLAPALLALAAFSRKING